MTHTETEQLPILSVRELRGFDRRRVALIREMEEHGWRGRRSTRGHAIMRAPDCDTTVSISPKVLSGPQGANVGMTYRAWLRDQAKLQAQMTFPAADATSVLVALATRHHPDLPMLVQEDETFTPAPVDVTPVDTAPEPEVLRVAQRATEPELNAQCASRIECDEPGCDRDFATLQAMSVHRARSHVKADCPICGRAMAPGNLPRHQRKHAEQLGTHEEVMAEVLRLRAELARTRDEAAEWQSLAEATEAEYAELQAGIRALVEG